MKTNRKPRIVSPAKAERLKREAEQERRERRKLKLVLIGIAAATVIVAIAFCAWYSVWIKQPRVEDHQHHERASAGHDH